MNIEKRKEKEKMQDWLYDVRDRMFNAMASWLMEHCRCATYTFWICCSRFSNAEVRAYADTWLKWRENNI